MFTHDFFGRSIIAKRKCLIITRVAVDIFYGIINLSVLRRFHIIVQYFFAIKLRIYANWTNGEIFRLHHFHYPFAKYIVIGGDSLSNISVHRYSRINTFGNVKKIFFLIFLFVVLFLTLVE